MHLALSLAAALVSAVLLWAASPSVGLGWVAWVALAPAAAASLALPNGRAARLAVPLTWVFYLELVLVPALPFGLDHDQWGEPVIPILVADSPAVVVALVAIPLVGVLLYLLRFPQLVPCRPAGLGAVACILVPALAWTGLDLLRTKADPSGLWGPLFLTQHDTPASGLAALGGPWLVTFMLVACNYALALVAVAGRAVLRPALAAGALALVPVGVLALVDERSGNGHELTVAAVQPGYDTSEFGLPVLHYLRRAYRDDERATLDLVADLEPLTREAARRGARLVVWPEATAWVDPARTRTAEGAVVLLARETGAAIVVPYFQRSAAQSAAVVVRPDGTVTRAQPKQRPMWFLGENEGNRAPARPVAVAPVGSPTLVGTLLGVDNQDPASARTLAQRGADALAASTHDWEEMAVQQRALSQLHAAALRIPVVRADWRYGSAVIDRGGDIVADAPPGKRRTVVVAEVTAAGGTTGYSRIGDAFGWTALAAALSLWAAVRGRARVARRT